MTIHSTHIAFLNEIKEVCYSKKTVEFEIQVIDKNSNNYEVIIDNTTVEIENKISSLEEFEFLCKLEKLAVVTRKVQRQESLFDINSTTYRIVEYIPPKTRYISQLEKHGGYWTIFAGALSISLGGIMTYFNSSYQGTLYYTEIGSNSGSPNSTSTLNGPGLLIMGIVLTFIGIVLVLGNRK